MSKVSAYWTQHWKHTGVPTGAWWAAKDAPKLSDINDGFFVVFHPEQDIQETMLPCIAERRGGFLKKITEIDLSKYLPFGSKLSFRQRLKGTI